MTLNDCFIAHQSIYDILYIEYNTFNATYVDAVNANQFTARIIIQSIQNTSKLQLKGLNYNEVGANALN